jgi:hypothetical protein
MAHSESSRNGSVIAISSANEMNIFSRQLAGRFVFSLTLPIASNHVGNISQLIACH